MEICLRDDIKTMLKSVSSKARKGSIISDQCRGGLSFGLVMSLIEETTIKTILHSNTIR